MAAAAAVPRMAEDIVDRMLTPNFLTASQWRDSRRPHRLGPESKLELAVLETAWQDWMSQKPEAGETVTEWLDRRVEAHKWLLGWEPAQACLSFDHVCATLFPGWEPDVVAAALLRGSVPPGLKPFWCGSNRSLQMG